MLKFGQKEVTTKDFYGQRQITDIFTIDVNKLVISNKVPCNNGKDCRYIVSYQVDWVLIPLFIKTPKNIFSYGVSQYDKNSMSLGQCQFLYNVIQCHTIPIQCHSMSLRNTQYKKIWCDVESQLFEKLAAESIKGNNVRGKLKTWKKDITNFHGRIVPNNMYCNATAVLKVDFVYKQGKNHHPQTYVEEFIYPDVEKQ